MNDRTALWLHKKLTTALDRILKEGRQHKMFAEDRTVRLIYYDAPLPTQARLIKPGSEPREKKRPARRRRK